MVVTPVLEWDSEASMGAYTILGRRTAKSLRALPESRQAPALLSPIGLAAHLWSRRRRPAARARRRGGEPFRSRRVRCVVADTIDLCKTPV
jgi:hypothetical protein